MNSSKSGGQSHDKQDDKRSSPPLAGKEGVRLCYTCAKPGHLAKNCQSRKTESPRHINPPKKTGPGTKQITTAPGEDPTTDYLLPDP